jgi:hypothetical protein
MNSQQPAQKRKEPFWLSLSFRGYPTYANMAFHMVVKNKHPCDSKSSGKGFFP